MKKGTCTSTCTSTCIPHAHAQVFLALLLAPCGISTTPFASMAARHLQKLRGNDLVQHASSEVVASDSDSDNAAGAANPFDLLDEAEQDINDDSEVLAALQEQIPIAHACSDCAVTAGRKARTLISKKRLQRPQVPRPPQRHTHFLLRNRIPRLPQIAPRKRRKSGPNKRQRKPVPRHLQRHMQPPQHLAPAQQTQHQLRTTSPRLLLKLSSTAQRLHRAKNR